jgi:hypothetical protein
MAGKRQVPTAAFKARVALAALKGGRTITVFGVRVAKPREASRWPGINRNVPAPPPDSCRCATRTPETVSGRPRGRAL